LLRALVIGVCLVAGFAAVVIPDVAAEAGFVALCLAVAWMVSPSPASAEIAVRIGRAERQWRHLERQWSETLAVEPARRDGAMRARVAVGCALHRRRQIEMRLAELRPYYAQALADARALGLARPPVRL
jgi:hypothetical protein